MYCRECGKEIDERAAYCASCGAATRNAPPKKAQPDSAMRWILPVGRSGYAIAAGYLGLFSVLKVFAPFALLFGILAVRDIKKHKDKLGMGRAIFGIVMGGIFTIVLIAAALARLSG